jgi:polyhydroxybutyrate depolymerase
LTAKPAALARLHRRLALDCIRINLPARFFRSHSMPLVLIPLFVCAWLLPATAGASPLETERDVPGWPGRPYDLLLPSNYGELPRVPLIVAIHGGGGNKTAQRRLGCPRGDVHDAGCLHAIADAAGFAVAYPSGTGHWLLRNVRTWNAGGGMNGFQCVSGRACRDGVDDVAYFNAMLDDIGANFQVDADAVYLTGMSNGAAMAHRLACALPGRIAGIAPVGGANQYAALAPCTAATAVLQIHGDADPCWSYLGGETACADKNSGIKVSVADTVAGWARRNACKGTPVVDNLPDTSADGTTATAHRYQACVEPLSLILIENGGHTWPGGYQYFRERRIGKMCLDFNASDAIVTFFKDHRAMRSRQ